MNQRKAVSWPLWELVERERGRRGWTYQDLEDRAGVSRITISNWRKSQRPPNPRTVIAVADALSIDHDVALKAARGEHVTAVVDDCPYSEPAERAIWAIAGLTAGQRHALIACMRALISA